MSLRTLLICAVFFCPFFLPPVETATGLENKSEILVSAAISLKDSLREIAALYESRTTTKVRFNLGASGILQRQIEAGAPVDLFISAGNRQMNELQTQGLIITETRRKMARNDLVIAVPGDSRSILAAFPDLIKPDIKRLAIGNPKTVPAGQYAEQTLKNLGLWSQVQSRLILAEDARQILDYLMRSEVDAGLIYASDAIIAGNKVRIVARAPEHSHEEIVYSIAVIKNSRHLAEVGKFIEVVLSAAGRQILAKYGFLSAQ